MSGISRCNYYDGDTKELLTYLNIAVLGDSIQRSVYKDIVCLLQSDCYLTDRDLRKKGEYSFMGDKLIYGGQRGKQRNSVNYRECRCLNTAYDTCIRYYFVTRCFNDYVHDVLEKLSDENCDIIIMNSCLWDVHRYNSIDEYGDNLQSLVSTLRRILPKCLFIWVTVPPVDIKSKGGFLENPGKDYVKIEDVKSCNQVARDVFAKARTIYGNFEVVDLEYHFKYFEHHRASDGVHWDEVAHRRMSYMILAKIFTFSDNKRYSLPAGSERKQKRKRVGSDDDYELHRAKRKFSSSYQSLSSLSSPSNASPYTSQYGSQHSSPDLYDRCSTRRSYSSTSDSRRRYPLTPILCRAKRSSDLFFDFDVCHSSTPDSSRDYSSRPSQRYSQRYLQRSSSPDYRRRYSDFSYGTSQHPRCRHTDEKASSSFLKLLFN